MESSRSPLGVDVVSSEQVIESEATRNVLEKQQIRWAKRGDTTPSVLNVERLQFRNTSSTLVTKFDDGKPGQQVTILGDGFTTLQNNTKIVTASGADTLLADGEVHQFTMWEDRVWREHAGSGSGGGGGAGVTSFNSRTGAVTPQPGDYTASDVGATPASHLTDADPHTQYVLDAEKGVASGIPTLGLDILVPTAQLGTGVADNTKFLRGDKTWATPAGGGGGSIQIWHWDKPPASPSAIDDEFSAALSGWTNFGSAATQRVVGGNLELTGLLNSGANMGGVERTLPAGNFTVITRVNVAAENSFSLSGLFLRSSVSGRIKFFTLQIQSATITSCDCNYGNYTAFNVRSSFGTAKTVANIPYFLRISYDGTNLIFELSKDGTSWTLYLTEAVGTWFTGGNLPDRVGVAVDSFSASTKAKAAFSFFRYYNTSQADTGGFITVS